MAGMNQVRVISLQDILTVVLKLDRLYWIVQCFTSPPTQYRLYGRRGL